MLLYLCLEISIVLILHGNAAMATIQLHLDLILLLPCPWKQSHQPGCGSQGKDFALKYHFVQKEIIIKFCTIVSEVKRYFCAQASAPALWGRWNQTNQLHKVSSSAKPVHISSIHPTKWKLENPAPCLHTASWFARSFVHLSF